MSDKTKKIKSHITPGQTHWVGDGFLVNTLFSSHQNDYHDITPFIMMDHAAPKHFAPTSAKLGVGEHPHRGFETVTFAINGEVEHRDSGGGGGIITTGGVQWMSAASGVVHDEFHSRNFAKSGGTFEMVQLWVNLPAKDKMSKPRYQSLNKEDFPLYQYNESVSVKVITGKISDYHGPAKTFTPMNIYEIDNTAASKIDLEFEEATTTLICILAGSIEVSGQKAIARELLIFERDGKDVSIAMNENSKILVLNAWPIDEPIASYGPFVMNTQQEIMEAIEDYKNGKLGTL